MATIARTLKNSPEAGWREQPANEAGPAGGASQSPADANGFRTATPVPAKCATLRVTTVRPCSSAVAVICLSQACSGLGTRRRPQTLVKVGCRLRYALKAPYCDGTTHLVLEPLDLMARLAARVPPRQGRLL